MKNFKGITLTSLVITVIVMVILAGIALLFSVGKEGVIERATDAKKKAEIAELKEEIGLEYLALKNDEKNKDKSTFTLFEELRDKMQLQEYFLGNESFVIDLDKENYITLLKDGTIIDGKKIELNIADGSIDIKASGFIQNNSDLKKYVGDYIITGTTDEYYVRVMEKGNYNITIKDLKIDFTSKTEICPLNLNGVNAQTDLIVELNLEGENYLYGGLRAPGIRFARGEANINSVTNGSTLIIQGTGSVYAQGGDGGSGIGNGYSNDLGGHVTNIIINSGNITVKPGVNACGIGAGLYANVSNIIINGGNINAIASNRYGIGSIDILDNLVINGGNITATGGEYGAAIGGGTGSGKIVINGGILNLEKTANNSKNITTLGNRCDGIIINGGVINCYSKNGAGIGSMSTLPFKLEINSGEINIDDKICSTPVNLSNGNWYLIKFKIGELAKQLKVESVQTNNNIEYETENLYIMENGHLYMFLPEGEVTVSVTVAGITYTGTVVVTPENTEVFTLTQN